MIPISQMKKVRFREITWNFWKFPPSKRLFQNFNSETPNPEFKLLIMPLSQHYKDQRSNSYLLDGCC